MDGRYIYIYKDIYYLIYVEYKRECKNPDEKERAKEKGIKENHG